MLAQAEILRLLLFPTFTDSNINQRCLTRLKQRKLRSGSEKLIDFLLALGLVSETEIIKCLYFF